MNALQKQFRIVSDYHIEDTAVEMRACERASRLLAVTERALADGMITTSEGLKILREARATLADCQESLARNPPVQRALDAAISRLGELPPDAVARIPEPAWPQVAA